MNDSAFNGERSDPQIMAHAKYLNHKYIHDKSKLCNLCALESTYTLGGHVADNKWYYENEMIITKILCL